MPPCYKNSSNKVHVNCNCSTNQIHKTDNKINIDFEFNLNKYANKNKMKRAYI